MTQKEIAKMFGVSIMTVSRVLSGKTGNKVSPGLSEKIRKAAEQGNYQENRLAKAMRTGVVPLSALCLNKSCESKETGYYWFDIVSHHTAILSSHQQEVLLVPFSTVEELSQRLTTLRRANLISSVVANIQPGAMEEELKVLKDLGLPFVVLGNAEDPSVPHVYVDNSSVPEILTKKLQEKGAVSVLYYGSESGLPTASQIADKSCFFHVHSAFYKRDLICKTKISEDRIYLVTHDETSLNGLGGFVVDNHTGLRCENVWKLLKMQFDNTDIDRDLFRIPITEEDIRYIPPMTE